MKKFLIFVILVIIGYFVYENFIKKEEVLEIKGNLIKIREGANADAPAIQPRTWAFIEGTVKNSGDKDVFNINIVYKINGKESSAKISKLSAGEETKFKTDQIMIGSYETSHYIEKITFDEQ